MMYTKIRVLRKLREEKRYELTLKGTQNSRQIDFD
jgi:hypothetical protein